MCQDPPQDIAAQKARNRADRKTVHTHNMIISWRNRLRLPRTQLASLTTDSVYIADFSLMRLERNLAICST